MSKKVGQNSGQQSCDTMASSKKILPRTDASLQRTGARQQWGDQPPHRSHPHPAGLEAARQADASACGLECAQSQTLPDAAYMMDQALQRTNQACLGELVPPGRGWFRRWMGSRRDTWVRSTLMRGIIGMWGIGEDRWGGRLWASLWTMRYDGYELHSSLLSRVDRPRSGGCRGQAEASSTVTDRERRTSLVT
jgi:hypothetical protein